MKDLRQSEKGILALDSGDLLFKKYLHPIPENGLKGMREKAYLMIESFNLMGYDAIGIGDDDLALGKEFLLEISKKANFPFLCSNLIDETSGKILFQSFLIKEIQGLRIGIFALLSPDFFSGPSDPRKKGLIFKSPVETAQVMVKELKSKTDLIILLSHLGYVKDIELIQTVQGINIIVGGHNGINFIYPPVIKNTIILQNASRGVFGARLDLSLYNDEPTFYNATTKISLENNLNRINQRLNAKETSEAEKAQWRKAKEEAERTLNQLQGKNVFTNHIITLQEQMKEHPNIKNIVEAHKARFPTKETSASPQ